MIWKINKKRIGFLIAILMLIFLHYISVLQPIENIIINLASPLSKITYQTKQKINKRSQLRNDRKNLEELYLKEIEKNKSLQIFSTKNEILAQENKELKDALNFKQKTKYKSVTTVVIGKNSENTSKMLIIDAGKSEGLETGQPVVVYGGILIGTVAKVENNISFIRLVTDNQSKIAATLLNKDKSLGVVEGGHGISLLMNLIPREEAIIIGDKVVTSGLNQGIPKGLLIGEVAIAENEAYQPFQRAFLNPATNLSKINVISIIMNE